MPLVLTDLGADAMNQVFWNKVLPGGGNDFTLKLFTNNYTPVQTSVAADFTEATGGGYVAKVLSAGSFSIVPANDPSDVTYAQRVFTFSGALTTNPTIYGAYVEDADGVVIIAEAKPSYTPIASGEYKLTFSYQLSGGTPA